jgi:hypothetical protein
MAVLEYEKFSDVFNPRNPVYHQVEFVNLVRSSPEAFIVRSKVQNGKLLDSAKNVMRELRDNSWGNINPVRRQVLDFLFPAAPSAAPQPEASKPRQRGKARGKGAANKQTDTSALDPAHQQSGGTNLTYNALPFRTRAKNNVLLTGLIADMPGVHKGEHLYTDDVVVEEVSIFDGPSMSQLLDGLYDCTAADADGDAAMGEDMDDVDEVDELISAAATVDNDDGFFIGFLPPPVKHT